MQNSVIKFTENHRTERYLNNGPPTIIQNKNVEGYNHRLNELREYAISLLITRNYIHRNTLRNNGSSHKEIR